ncbi:hypothetical protein ASE16_04125 [Leifsonia sp. Root227]|uniref:DUF2142 domain-containing protein n=1 Tax=unclassified Leifsonia TaxID=2663824 RepID=UPI0006FC65C8|nr:DUF2142 domain-containing protein [Leifsonia sp. Root227]KRC52232.1 hypothetical protein ASE16_04125 [Leifsonia sp. Root227]
MSTTDTTPSAGSLSTPQEQSTSERPRVWRAFLVVWVLLSALCASWAVATPIGASPDEPAHIVKAASVARGQFIGTPSADGHRVTVPAYVARTQDDTCFAFHQERPAACGLAPLTDPGALTTSYTTAGLYNPVYYLLVGWPTLLLHDTSGIYAMRIVSGIVTALFAALAFAVLWGLRRRAIPVLGFAVAVTPMLLFLGGSVNPNGVEATATLAVFAGILAVVLDPDRSRLLSRAMIVLASGAVAVNTRGLSPLWVLLAILIPFVLVPWRTVLALLRKPAVIAAAVGVVLATIAALAWTVGTNSLHNAVDNPDQTPQSFIGVGTNPLSGFFITLVRTAEYGHGLIGIFGWLDTPAPPEVYFIWAAMIGIVLVAALVLLRSRMLVFAWVLFGAFILLPPVIQAAYITGGGVIWQGRYNMPLFLCLIVGLAVVLATRIPADWATATWRRFAWLVVIVLAFGQLYAFENTLRRYSVTPIGSLKQFLFGTPPWAPPGGNLLSLLVFAALVVVACWLALRAVRRVGDADKPVTPVEPPAAI